MITFSCPEAKGKLKPDEVQRGIEVEYHYAPNIRDVNMNEIDGFALLKLLHLPRMAYFEFEVEQLPAFKSAIADLLGYQSEMDNVANNPFRFGMNAQITAQYMLRILKELALLVDEAYRGGHKVEWLVHP